VLVDAQITQLCDHRGLGRHFLAIAPNGGSARGYQAIFVPLAALVLSC